MKARKLPITGRKVPRREPMVDVPGDRTMPPLAGPPLANFFMFDEIVALRHLIPNDFILFLALVGLLLTLLLDFRSR